ncbi:MAG: preprotein translocase subunit SecG [Firmicutes bacterium]|nr:preprotein translocase subunit SecG [Bacillota bacterium]
MPAWVTESFWIIRIVIFVLLVLVGIVLIFAVLIQPSNSGGMGALTGQSSDTYYSKHKKQSLEGTMKRLTTILGIVMGVLAILFFVTVAIYPAGPVQVPEPPQG